MTGIITSGLGGYYLTALDGLFLHSDSTQQNILVVTAFALIVEIVVDTVSFVIEARQGMDFVKEWLMVTVS